MGYQVKTECPHCVNETNFWIIDNDHGICPCSARRSWSLGELKLSKPTYHGATKEACQWVVDSFSDHDFYKNNKTVQNWISQSKGILKDGV